MVNDSEVKTDVDRLLELVKQRKELSVEDAAKLLGVPPKTVESLSDLLEEEGMLHIKYKFTTPYLTSEMPGERAKAKKAAGEEEFVIEKGTEAPMPQKKEEEKVEIKPAEPTKIEIKPKVPVPSPKITPEPMKKKEEFAIPETWDIDELIRKANEFISKGDFESARQIYLRIKKIKGELPQRFLEEEKKVKETLVDLNEGIVGGIDKALSTDFSKKISEIGSLFDKANAHIELNAIKTLKDLEDVENIYLKIKEIYLSLPGGFMEKKVAIQDRMLELYRMLLSNKKNLLTDEFKSKSGEIMQLMSQLAEKINSRNIAEANKIFSNITQIYRSLPRGFLKEKTDLQNSILSTYQKLILSKEDVYSKDIKAKTDEIKGLIYQAMNLVNMDNIADAKSIYKRITDIYSTLPEGFYDVRADLEMKMLDLHHLIVLKHSRASVDEMNAKIREIDSLADSAANYLKEKETDLAKEAYKEIIEVYNSFPEGFIEQNIKIRESIVKLYRDILSSETKPLIGEADHETVKIYSELLKLLVQIHDGVKKKEFGRIKEKYLVAYKLYHELPLSFLEKKTSLYSEIFKIYEELKLYTELSKLAEYANNKEYDKLKDLLNLVIDAHSRLIKKYPEDIELFRHIHGKCLLYLDILKGRKVDTGKQVREKIEAVSAQKKMPEIEKPPELIAQAEKQSAEFDKTASMMPGIHPAEGPKKEIVSAQEYLKKKYNLLGQ